MKLFTLLVCHISISNSIWEFFEPKHSDFNHLKEKFNTHTTLY